MVLPIVNRDRRRHDGLTRSYTCQDPATPCVSGSTASTPPWSPSTTGCGGKCLSRRQGTCVRPVSGTASGVRASTLVSAMPAGKTIATVARHSIGHGITELSLPQPTQVSVMMKSMWDR